MGDADFWSQRYAKEGEIWAKEPSLTALFLSKALPKGAELFEIGFGYGRDLIYLAKEGYAVDGIERAAVGIEMANAHIVQHILEYPTKLLQGDFLTSALPQKKYDAIYAHRMLHLLQTPEEIEAFVKRCKILLKPGGMLVLSARDDRGVKPERKGHHVSFWDTDRFKNVFEQEFEIQSFIQGEEIESKSNSHPTYFTIMQACKL